MSLVTDSEIALSFLVLLVVAAIAWEYVLSGAMRRICERLYKRLEGWV
jgi:hypothetical protein